MHIKPPVENKYPIVPSLYLGKEVIIDNGLLPRKVTVVEINLAFIFVVSTDEDGVETRLAFRRSDGTLFSTDERLFPEFQHYILDDDVVNYIQSETMIGQNVSLLIGHKEVYGRGTVFEITDEHILLWIITGYSSREGHVWCDRLSGEEIKPAKGNNVKIEWTGMTRINSIHGIPGQHKKLKARVKR